MGTVLTLSPKARGGALPASTGFEEFFRTEYPLLVRISYGIVRDPHLAEDVAQDVLIAARGDFQSPSDQTTRGPGSRLRRPMRA
jgi:DNA-directed RNA polymerase specialized sigma24 family protein